MPESESDRSRKGMVCTKNTDGCSLKVCNRSNFLCKLKTISKLENVFVKHYAPNHMPNPKGEWSLKENDSELHYGICSKVVHLHLGL